MGDQVPNQREPAELTAADVDTAIDRITARDPELGRGAAHIYETLTWGEGPQQFRQAALQDWLWYRIPTRYLTDEPGYMTRLADTAATLFDELGLHRYAAICRSATTHTVHTAYERSDTAGRAALRTALNNSGIQPPNIDGFDWGEVMGWTEHDAHTTVENALETAIATGQFVVGARNWRRHQTDITATALDQPHPDQPGHTWLTAIIAERLDHWVDGAQRRNPTLGELRHRTVDWITTPIDPPPDVADMMRPITWFLTEFGDEQPLTTAGYLTPTVTRHLHTDAPWDDPYSTGRPPRTELDAIIVHKVRTWLQAAGALRKHNKTLRRTRHGATCATNPTQAWELLATNLAHHPWDRFVTETAALILVNHPDPIRPTDLAAHVADHAGDMGWQTTEDHQRRPTERDVSRVLHPTLALLNLFDVITETGDWRNRRITLTPNGTITMLATIRATATRPRTHPG